MKVKLKNDFPPEANGGEMGKIAAESAKKTGVFQNPLAGVDMECRCQLTTASCFAMYSRR